MKKLPFTRWFTLLGMLWLLLALAEPGLAKAPAHLSENALVFQGMVDQSFMRTFSLVVDGDEAVQQVQVIPRDLSEAESGLVLSASTFSIDPSGVPQVEQTQLFTVTLSGATTPGNYGGSWQVTFQDKDGQVYTEMLEIQANLSAVPQVDADVNSKNRSLNLVSHWSDLPYLGYPCRSEDCQPSLGSTAIDLVQKGPGEATILGGELLTPWNNAGDNLPYDTLVIDHAFPFPLTSRIPEALPIVARGSDLPAGAYQTTLYVNVQDQDLPVEVPLIVNFKDGPLAALLVLVIAPVLGILVNWWNNDGIQARKFTKQIQDLEAKIERGEKLQGDDRQAAYATLVRAMDALQRGAPAAEVQANLTQVEVVISQAQKAADDFLNGDFKELQNKLFQDEEQPGTHLRAHLSEELIRIKKRVQDGWYQKLEQAIGLLAKEPKGRLRQDIEDLDQLVVDFKALKLGAEQYASFEERLNKAKNIREMREIYEQAKASQPGREEEESFGIRESKPTPEEPRGIAEIHRRYTRYLWRLRWRRILLVSLVYLFTLFVGWSTLYLANSTFGARPEDYITLLLWGMAANVFGGQAVNLRQIYEQKAEPVGDGGEATPPASDGSG